MDAVVDIRAGDSYQEGTTLVLRKWLKQPGESVNAHEPVAEIETDKVVVELAAPAEGTVTEILKAEGEPIALGEVLARLRPKGQGVPSAAVPEAAEPDNGGGSDRPDGDEGAEVQREGARLSPAVRRLLQEHELDAAQIQGSGLGGRITVRDVQAYLEGRNSRRARVGTGPARGPQPARSEPPAPSPGGIESRVIPHTPMRRRIAERMVESLLHTAPHVTTVFEADLSAVLRHFEAHKPLFEQRGVKLTLTAYFVRACVEAMRAVPEVNARFHDDHLEIFQDVNIGIATALGRDGLIVPVLHKAQEQSFLGIASKLHELTRKARAGELEPADVQDGTFTVSNHGVSGSLLASPIIINQPQVAILGIGRMEKRVVVKTVDGQDAMQIRPMCYVTLTIDHRALDGATANGFLTRLVEALENWLVANDAGK